PRSRGCQLLHPGQGRHSSLAAQQPRQRCQLPLPDRQVGRAPGRTTKGSIMKIALDPYMFRSTPLLELPGLVAELGYEYLELSPREDFMPFFLMHRCDDATVKAFKKALDAAGVKVSSNLPLYRWSGPDEDERQAAVRYWKRAIEITVQLECTVRNSEFNGRP